MVHSYKRRKVFIDKKLQSLYALILFCALTMILSLTSWMTYRYVSSSVLDQFSNTHVQEEIAIAQRISEIEHQRYLTSENFQSHLPGTEQEARLISQHNIQKLAQIFSQLHRFMFPQLISLILIISMVSLFLSHKVAGPVFHINRCLQKLAHGNLKTRVHLRKFDQLKDLGNTFNTTISQLDRDMQQLNHEFNALEEILKSENLTSNDQASKHLGHIQRILAQYFKETPS